MTDEERVRNQELREMGVTVYDDENPVPLPDGLAEAAASMASGETLAEMIQKKIAYFNSNLKEPLSAKDEEAVAGATRSVDQVRSEPQADVPCKVTGQMCLWRPNIHAISPYFCEDCRRDDPRDVYDLYEGRIEQMHERRAGHPEVLDDSWVKSNGTVLRTPKLAEDPCEQTGKGCEWKDCCETCNDVYCDGCGRFKDWDKDDFNPTDRRCTVANQQTVWDRFIVIAQEVKMRGGSLTDAINQMILAKPAEPSSGKMKRYQDGTLAECPWCDGPLPPTRPIP